MRIDIPFFPGNFNLKIPEDFHTEVLYPNEVKCRNGLELLHDALENPVNSISLKEFFNTGEDILILINDATRPTPTARLLEAMTGQLKNERVRFLVATGTHRPPTEEELRSIMGRFFRPFKRKIHIHDSRNQEDLVEAGVTPAGTGLWINKLVVRFRKIVTINSVEPHYFAGYTGGRKSFFPGVAGYRSVEKNHELALSEYARPLNLTGNPVHGDMMKSLQCLEQKEIFSIQSVLDRHHEIYSLVAGNIHDSFIRSTQKADEVFSVNVRGRADIVLVVVTPPKSINLYQAQNAIENAKLVLKERGILILVSPCAEGVGPPAFFNLLSRCAHPREVNELVRNGYRLGYHKAVKFAEIAEKADIWAVTRLPDSLLKKIFVRGFSDLKQAMTRAVEIKGKQARMVVLMDGDKIVPRIKP